MGSAVSGRDGAVSVADHGGDEAVGNRDGDGKPRVSPDGKSEAYIRDYNIWTRPAGSNASGTQLSLDGARGNAYDLKSVNWSPDSQKIAAYRLQPGYKREIHYVESSPDDQLQPKPVSRPYSKPGDILDINQPVLVDVASRKTIAVSNALFPNAYTQPHCCGATTAAPSRSSTTSADTRPIA